MSALTLAMLALAFPFQAGRGPEERVGGDQLPDGPACTSEEVVDEMCEGLGDEAADESVAQRVASGQQAQPGISVPPPTARVQQTYVVPLSASDELVGSVEVHTLDKQLTIDWSHGVGTREFFAEAFDVSYWPTAAARVSDARLSTGGDLTVAGKRPSLGTTVIERWTFSFPAGVPTAGVPTLVAKSVLYEGNQLGKRVVRMMTPTNGVRDQTPAMATSMAMAPRTRATPTMTAMASLIAPTKTRTEMDARTSS